MRGTVVGMRSQPSLFLLASLPLAGGCEPALDGPMQDWRMNDDSAANADTSDTATPGDTAADSGDSGTEPGPVDPCLATGVVAEWSFEEGSGSVAADGSGHGLDGELLGASWTDEGAVGGGVHLDGDDSVSLDHAANWPTSALTVAGWARPSVLRGYNVIVAHGSTDGIINPFHLGFKEGTPLWTTDAETLGPALHDESAAPSAVDAWHHLVGTWDGANGARALYVGGALLMDDAEGPPALAYDDIASRVGADVNAGEATGFFVGDLDEVLILDCAVSAEGAAEIFRGQ